MSFEERQDATYAQRLKGELPAGTKAPPPVKKLENRLAKALSLLNNLNHENKEQRDQIDQVRRERLQMNQVFKRMQKDIGENVHNVTHLHRETDVARREHDDNTHRMNALKRQLEIERRTFKNEVQKLQKEMKDKEKEELIQRVAMVKASLDHGDDKKTKTRGLKADEEDNFNSTAVMRRILKLAFLNAIQRRHIRQHEKNIEVFEQAFATIKSTTGISDIEEIVKIFMSLEQRNFSLLTYVNTLNREIESFDKRNRELQDQIMITKNQEAETEQRRHEQLAELKANIKSTREMTEDNVNASRAHRDTLERCLPQVQTLLRTIEKEHRGFGGQPMEGASDNFLAWLTYIEKTLTQWKDFLPEAKDTRHYQSPMKNYRYTVGSQVLTQVQPRKQGQQPAPLVKPSDLPSAANAFQENQPGRAIAARDEDSSTDEEELMKGPWSRSELKEKALQSVAKRKKHRKVEQSSHSAGAAALETTAGPRLGEDAAGTAPAGEKDGDLAYDDMVEKNRDRDEDSLASDDSDADDDEAGPTEEEINEIFLKRYKMSREELQQMADKMGIQLNNLCYLKQEFDAYDEDRSGYIDVKELKELLEKLGEELSEDELEQAFRELDQDGSGEIEFFEFVEWFTSED
jgi:hypothetical protein